MDTPTMQLVTRLARNVGGGEAMSGTDPIGRLWSRRYVPAAHRAVRAVADVLTPGAVLPAGRPGASSPSGTDPPPTWELVARVAGSAWPDGRPDVLRTAAQAWLASADVLLQAAWSARMTAEAARWQTLSRAHRTLGSACRGLADDLDRAHAGIAGALTAHSLEAHLDGAIAYAGPDGPVQTAVGWRVAAAAVQVTAVIGTFAAAADLRARTLPFVGELCADVSRLAVSA